MKQRPDYEFRIVGPKPLLELIVKEATSRGWRFNEHRGDDKRVKLYFNTSGYIVNYTDEFTQDRFIFDLNSQWGEVIQILDDINPNTQVKVGDYAICLPGFTNRDNHPTKAYGGGAYEEGIVFKVSSIEPNTSSYKYLKLGKHIIGSEDLIAGRLYSNCVRKATEEEIAKLSRTEFVIGDFETQKNVLCTKGCSTVIIKGVSADECILDVKEIKLLVSAMNNSTTIKKWRVSFSTVNVGCVKNITLKQLTDILDFVGES